MNISQPIHSIRHFTDMHHPLWLDLIRIFLGIVIFIKGIFFINNSAALLQILHDSRIAGWSFIVEHHVAFTYLVGGILIALGLLTRIAIAFELPVFFGSIFCYYTQTGFFSVYSDLIFSLIVFGLLIFYIFWGPGVFSVDTYMKNHASTGQG